MGCALLGLVTSPAWWIKITGAPPPVSLSTPAERFFTTGSVCRSSWSWRSKLSPSPCCDCLLFRMCCVRCCWVQLLQRVELTFFYTHARTHTHILVSIIHNKTCACSGLQGEPSLVGLFSFESATDDDFMDHTFIMLAAM